MEGRGLGGELEGSLEGIERGADIDAKGSGGRGAKGRVQLCKVMAAALQRIDLRYAHVCDERAQLRLRVRVVEQQGHRAVVAYSRQLLLREPRAGRRWTAVIEQDTQPPAEHVDPAARDQMEDAHSRKLGRNLERPQQPRFSRPRRSDDE